MPPYDTSISPLGHDDDDAMTALIAAVLRDQRDRAAIAGQPVQAAKFHHALHWLEHRAIPAVAIVRNVLPAPLDFEQ